MNREWPYNFMEALGIDDEKYDVEYIAKDFDERLNKIILNDSNKFTVAELNIIYAKFKDNKKIITIQDSLGVSGYKVRITLAKVLRKLRHPAYFKELIK